MLSTQTFSADRSIIPQKLSKKLSARFMDFKLSYNFWYNCSIMFLKSDRMHDKAIETVIIHSKTSSCINIELMKPIRMKLVIKKRQNIALS